MAVPPSIRWQNGSGGATPLDAARLNEQQDWIDARATEAQDAVVEAQNARADAEAAAAAAAAPTDAQVSGLIGDSASATRAALSGVYATSGHTHGLATSSITGTLPLTKGGTGATTATAALAALGAAAAADLAALQQSAATIEDLFVTAPLISAGTITASSSFPVFVAPFPLVITHVSLVRWNGTNLALSDTNYWEIQVRKMAVDGTTSAILATKTTRSTAGGGLPAGEAQVMRVPWTYDTATISGTTVAARETVNIAFFPTGTATAIGAPFLATIGYRPL